MCNAWRVAFDLLQLRGCVIVMLQQQCQCKCLCFQRIVCCIPKPAGDRLQQSRRVVDVLRRYLAGLLDECWFDDGGRCDSGQEPSGTGMGHVACRTLLARQCALSLPCFFEAFP